MGNDHHARLSYIDGLKGIAILYVLLFHAYMRDFPAGFLGVDIFFVISGYFLFNGRYFQRHTLVEFRSFLAKKVVRLIAPVTVMVLLTAAAAPFLVLPRELDTSLYTGLYTLLGCSNLYLSSSSNQYFSPDTAYNPFVHTWYISVLIQIFLLYALGSIILKKVSLHKKRVFLFIVCIISLSCSTHGIITHHIKNFEPGFSLPFDYYSTTTRLWEVLAGGCVVLMKKRADKAHGNLKQLVSMLCLLLIILTPFFCAERGHNIRPVIIVLSTMICMAYGNKSLCGAILSWNPLRKLGKISFSLYLVHMPILAFYRAAPAENLHTDLAVAISMLLLAVLFYFLIEQRKFKMGTIGLGWIITLCATGFLAISHPTGLFLWKSYYARYSPYENWTKCENKAYFKGLNTSVFAPCHHAAWMSRSKDSETDNKKLPISREILLTIGKQAQPNFLLIGDSFAAMLYYGLNDRGKQRGISGLYLQTYIVPFYGWCHKGEKASDKCEALISWLKQHPEIHTVIISQHWKTRVKGAGNFTREAGCTVSEEEGLELFVRKIRESGRRVALIAQLPILDAVIPRSERMQMTAFDARTCSRQDYEAWSKDVNEMLDRLSAKGLCSIIHLEDAYFHDGLMRASENGEYLMFDNAHLSPHGSRKIISGNGDKLLPWIGNK